MELEIRRRDVLQSRRWFDVPMIDFDDSTHPKCWYHGGADNARVRPIGDRFTEVKVRMYSVPRNP